METPNLELETLKQLLKQQEKLASLGLLSAGIAHEIQNPLNFVINFSKMSYKLLKDLYEVLEDNKDKIGEADREEIDDIVSDLRENMNKIVEHVNVPSIPFKASCLFPEERRENLSLQILTLLSRSMLGFPIMP